MSRYREHPPPPDLAELVACTWERAEAAEPDGRVRVLPDGCVDLVWSTRGGLVIAGPDTGPVVYPVEPGLRRGRACGCGPGSRAACSDCPPPSCATSARS